MSSSKPAPRDSDAHQEARRDSPAASTAASTARVLMVAGPGGVGKTSMAAALAVAAAMLTEMRVLVLTVDPARRLADALGMDLPGQQATQITSEAAQRAGVELRGELWAGMLDVQAGWDELIQRHAPTPEIAERILANSLYANLTRRFVHSHDYLAMERLHEVTSSGEYDLVILDTPPSRNALDLLDAPQRMQEFFGSRLIRWLTVPARSRVANLVSQPFQQVADRLLGAGFLSDITEFFSLFQTMEEGFVRHAHEVEAQMAAPGTRFVVVATAEVAPVHEARFLIDELARRKMHLAGVIVNRVAWDPREVVDRGGFDDLEEVAQRLAQELGVDTDPHEHADVGTVQSMLGQLRSRAAEITELASHQERLIAEFAIGVPSVLRCPILDRDVHDLTDLAELAGHVSVLAAD
jgi:anion-transporting  ArsA/GET3 family ATPase